MASGGDVAQATREKARLGVSTIIEGVATGIIEVGAATPVVAPLCIALRQAKGVVDGASRNKDDLEQASEWCDMITVQVIDECKRRKSVVDVSPLAECISKLTEVARRYHDQGRFARMAQFRRDGKDIQRLRDSIKNAVSTMGLAGVVNIQDQLEDVRQLLARLQPRPVLAAVPKGVPMGRFSHAVRCGVVDRVCKILGCEAGPTVAALTGRSGAGKTTAAAAMVGERGPIRPRPGETEDQTCNRLDRLRALFPHGVVWLRVGRGGGAPNRLPHVMRGLAKAFHEDVMESNVDAPAVGEDGETYVKKIVSQESLRCLVVADDVWEEEVVRSLRETGLWVLLTTRKASMVEPRERVVVDELTQAEAEDVLRGAARLPQGERLCDDAMEVLEICGRVAMDIAFVGSWSCVRTADNGVPKSNGAWADAVRQIATQVNHVRGDTDGMDTVDINRLAVLRAGFKYLGVEDAVAQELYLALAVFPDGYAFKDSDATMLLNDREPPADHQVEVAMGAIGILERWAVLRADASGLYRMHDAHVGFARGKLEGCADIRMPVVRRWTSHISRLDFLVGSDLYALLDIWRVVERVEGESLLVSRPYDDHLVRIDASDLSPEMMAYAVHAVAELYENGLGFVELEALARKVLKHCKGAGARSAGMKRVALAHLTRGLASQGRFEEAVDIHRQLGGLSGSYLQLETLFGGDNPSHTSTIFNTYGSCALAAEHRTDAEQCFRHALKTQQDAGLGESPQAVDALRGLGLCVAQAGRPGEAEEFFGRALAIVETRLGIDDLQAAWMLHEMGRCARQGGRLGEAEELLTRALDIKTAKLRPNDFQTVLTTRELSLCARAAGREGEANELCYRALFAELKGTTWIQNDLRRGWKLLVAEPTMICFTFFAMGLALRFDPRVEDSWWWFFDFVLLPAFVLIGIGCLISLVIISFLYVRRGGTHQGVIFVDGVPIPRDNPPPFAVVALFGILTYRLPTAFVLIFDTAFVLLGAGFYCLFHGLFILVAYGFVAHMFFLFFLWAFLLNACAVLFNITVFLFVNWPVVVCILMVGACCKLLIDFGQALGGM